MTRIVTRGDELTVTLPDGRSATVPFDPTSSLLSSAGRAAIRIATHLAEKAEQPNSSVQVVK